jgi:hypothetical protein
MLGVFSISMSSFKSEKPTYRFFEVDCNDVAAAAWQEAIDQGATNDQAYEIFVGAHQACENAKTFRPTIGAN